MKLGDLLGDTAKENVKEALNGKTFKFVRNAVGNDVGEKVANVTNTVLEKAGIQKEDGTIVIKIPFVKSTDESLKKILSSNPEREKLCVRFGESLKDGFLFFSVSGHELYRVEKSRKNDKHLELIKGKQKVAEIEKKTPLLKNPLSDAEKYEITMDGSVLGSIEVKEQKLIKTYAKPDFDTWEIQQKGFHYQMIDADGNVMAVIHAPGQSVYVFEQYMTCDFTLLILSFLTIMMRQEGKGR